MAIVKMQKVCVIGLDREKEEFISRLMDFGVVELTDQTAKLSDEIWAENVTADESRDKTARLEEKIDRANLALEVIEKYGNLKQPLFATRRRVSAQSMKRLMADAQETFAGQVEDILNLNDRLNALNERKNKLEQDEASLTAWQAYDLPLELTGTQKTLVQTGVLPMGTDTDALAGALAGQAETDGTVFKIVHTDKDLYYAAILMLAEQAADVQTILKQYGFSQVTFKDMEGTAGENLIRIHGEKDVLRAEYAQAAKEAAAKSACKADIEAYADMLTIAADKEKIKTKLLKTKRTFFLEGWIPERCMKKAAELLEAHECYYAFRKPEAEEEVPVLLENKSFFRPTEAITEMYSLPSYWGFDPTSIYALFYIVFFGMMFSDAGYGLLMAIGCFVILKKFDLEGTTWKMIRLFFYCGISTFVWGALFGGWFGDVVTVFSSTFLGKAAELKPLWFNPLDDPMKLLILSLILGVIHLFIGMGIQTYMEIKDGRWMDAICGEGVWYLTGSPFGRQHAGHRRPRCSRQVDVNHRRGRGSDRRRERQKRHRDADGCFREPVQYHQLAFGHPVLRETARAGTGDRRHRTGRQHDGLAVWRQYRRTGAVRADLCGRSRDQLCDQHAGCIHSFGKTAVCGILREVLCRRRRTVRPVPQENQVYPF